MAGFSRFWQDTGQGWGASAQYSWRIFRVSECVRYKQNPVVFPDHEHRSLPIGECVSIGSGDGALTRIVAALR